MSLNLLIRCLRNSGVFVLLVALLKVDSPVCLRASELAQSPLQQAALKDLLDRGWKVSLDGYQDARQRAEQLQLATRPDHRLGYATLLIQFRQRKYADAENSLQELLLQHPNYLPLWRARIWFSVLTRKHDVALAEVQQLGQLVVRGTLQTDAAQGGGVVPATADQLLQLATWTGQLVGFIEGPANTAINPVTLKQHRTLLAQRWNEAQRKAFEQGRKSVLKTFTGQQLATRQLEKDSQLEVQKRLQELDQRQQQIRKDLKQRREDLNDQKNDLRNELRDQQQFWGQEDRPLTNTLWRLDGQADTVWRSKNYLLSELNWLRLQLESEVDPIVIQQLMLRIDRLNSQLFWTDSNLSSLQNQSWTVQRTRVDLYWQHQQNQRLVNQQLNDSQKSLESVDRNEHRLDATMSRERRKAEAKSRRVRAAEAKSASLKAYLTFPMEIEKIRLLNSF